MKPELTADRSRDILGSRLVVGLAYWLPGSAIVVTGFLNLNQGLRSSVWVVALGVMGTACIVNALRCGRVHCYFTH